MCMCVMSVYSDVLLLAAHLVVFSLSLSFTLAAPPDHRYSVGDQVPLFVSKVGPLNNPSEIYQYYDLPFCSPAQVIKKKQSLGQILNGEHLASALYELKFGVKNDEAVLCQKKLNKGEAAKFRDAIMKDFYFQMYFDDLPFWGFIGKYQEKNLAVDDDGPMYFLFKHVRFDVLYNGDQILEIHAFGDPNHVVDITKDVEYDVKFTYSVFWNETPTQFKSRMDRYSRASLLQIHQKIHWFSVINSVVIIVLLIGLTAVLFMRNLKNDLRKYSSIDEEDDKDVSWRHIRADILTGPPYAPLFCAFLGAGMQLLTMVGFLFALAFLNVLYPYNSGALSTSLVITYTLTSVVAGYVSAYFCSQFAAIRWARSVTLAALLFFCPFLLIALFLNIVAICFGITSALPFGTILVIISVYALVAVPLLALGALLGRICNSRFQAPFTARKCSKEKIVSAWYQKTPGQMFLAGLLPFSGVVLELHNFYATLWGYKISVLPGILFIMFVVLAILTAILSVGLTYLQLTTEDHEWCWRSILRGGSTALFMFAYSIYFYHKSNMSGFVQTVFYFGYTACLCYAVFLMLGTIGFLASLMFVRRVYYPVKSE